MASRCRRGVATLVAFGREFRICLPFMRTALVCRDYRNSAFEAGYAIGGLNLTANGDSDYRTADVARGWPGA